MNVAGIDYSTRAVDIVVIPEEGPPVWHRYELVARGELDDPFERTREVGALMPKRFSVFWDEITAVGIEHPGGKWTGDMLRVQGAILSCIPSHLQVEPWPPAKWRKAVGLKGNCTKDAVRIRSGLIQAALAAIPPGMCGQGNAHWPQDAHDAHLIALATRQAITTTQAA